MYPLLLKELHKKLAQLLFLSQIQKKNKLLITSLLSSSPLLRSSSHSLLLLSSAVQGRGEHIPALNQVKSIIAGSNFTGNVFALTQVPHGIGL